VLGDGSVLDLLGSASGAPDVAGADLARRGVRVTQSPTSAHLPDRESVLAAAAEVFATWRAGVFGKRPVRTYPLSRAPVRRWRAGAAAPAPRGCRGRR
jgi:NADPH:quinone reductase